MTRFYTFDNILNFRDFGDYATSSGTVRPRKLFRSANFYRATDTDLNALSDLNVALIVDLRYITERQKQPSRWPERPSPLFFEFDDLGGFRDAEIAPHEAFVKNDLRRPDDARNYMLSSYKARPDDPGFRDIFAKTLKHMAATGDNIVIHCAAGKDRTGTLAAIILSALGVSQDVIMADYMGTMDAVDIEAFLEPASKMMAKKHGRDYSPDALRPMFAVEPDYLQSSLDAIGDMDRYIRDVLKISADDLANLRRHYVTEINS